MKTSSRLRPPLFYKSQQEGELHGHRVAGADTRPRAQARLLPTASVQVPGASEGVGPHGGTRTFPGGTGQRSIRPLLSTAPSGFILLMHRAGQARALDPQHPTPSHQATRLLASSAGTLGPGQPGSPRAASVQLSLAVWGEAGLRPWPAQPTLLPAPTARRPPRTQRWHLSPLRAVPQTGLDPTPRSPWALPRLP